VLNELEELFRHQRTDLEQGLAGEETTPRICGRH
jgi:hypothetical protein